MFVDAYTSLHSIIGLLALAIGVVTLLDFFGVRIPRFTAELFLLLVFLTSMTSFGLPYKGPRISDFGGVMALLALPVAIGGRFISRLPGRWRRSNWRTLLGICFLVIMFLVLFWGMGMISLIVLAAVAYARYARHLQGDWRSVYVIGVVWSEYFLAAIGTAQAFAKIPALQALAPTQSEPPVVIAQTVVLSIFASIWILAERGYRPKIMPPTRPRRMAG
jgi:hypothetical protein